LQAGTVHAFEGTTQPYFASASQARCVAGSSVRFGMLATGDAVEMSCPASSAAAS
jgi:hypothetical protein